MSASKKECPSCAMQVDKDSKNCPVCDYEFTSSPQKRNLAIWILLALFLFMSFYWIVRNYF